MNRSRPQYRGRRQRSGVYVAVAAAAFLLLGLVFLIVPGVRFSGYLFLLIAACCATWIMLQRWSEFSRSGKVCKWIFLAGVSAVLVLLLSLETLVIMESGGDDPEKPASAVIVLGAGVNGEIPSLSLQTRIDAAAAYLKENPEVPAVLSGGKGSGETISEAEAMRRGLAMQGIDEERLWLEERSVDTSENFRFSIEVLTEHGVDTTDTVAVVTNDFHLFRAKLIARRAGMTDLVGIPAKLPLWLEGNYYVREAFASVKTLVFN